MEKIKFNYKKYKGIHVEKSPLSNSLYLYITVKTENEFNSFKLRFSDHKIKKFWLNENREILVNFYINKKLLNKIIKNCSNETILYYIIKKYNIFNLDWNKLYLEREIKNLNFDIKQNNKYYFVILKSLYIQYTTQQNIKNKNALKEALLNKFNNFVEENNKIIKKY